MIAALSEQVLALLPLYGPWLIGLVTFCSCLAVPMPASMVMIAGGAFVASGDLSLGAVILAATGGALGGDILGYVIGRKLTHLLPRPGHARAEALSQAVDRLRARGAATVFLSRWLFSPLGPCVNMAAGAMRFDRRRFLMAAGAGELVWVSIYTGLGMVFGANLAAAAELAGDMLGLLAAGTVAVLLGWWLIATATPRTTARTSGPLTDDRADLSQPAQGPPMTTLSALRSAERPGFTPRPPDRTVAGPPPPDPMAETGMLPPTIPAPPGQAPARGPGPMARRFGWRSRRG